MMSEFASRLKTWLLARLRERTTWAGLTTLIAAHLGVFVAPEHAELIAVLGASFASVVLVGTKEKEDKDA